MEYRKLTLWEKTRLESQQCSAEDWERVLVHPEIDVKYIRDVRFSGDVRLGKFEKAFNLPGGMHKHSGLFHATLHDVTVGDNCCIENIKNYIARYDIAEDCFIENCDIILVDGETSFGNGTEVSVLNETGGREVTMHERLTAQEAYIEAMYRHRHLLVDGLKKMAADFAASRTSDRGEIGRGSTIVDAGYIKNVRVGECCKIEGSGRLKNGTIVSRQEAPVHIGYGVIADDFIVLDGSKVEDCTTLERCFVGQACTLGHGYSASDSLFFCNCQEENGEACAILAGPFTVTHHKSTLLIAGMFSFMNAGSGSNQSNHMYKLGPIHQGMLERGSKTASDSYILWPARIGAFSLVMGRHASNPDTRHLPFSYLIEKKGVTHIAPAVNLRSVGTVRDAQKWPKRDKRHPEGRRDMVNFNLLSPYTIGGMLRGIEVLDQLESLTGQTSDSYTYQSAEMSRHSLVRGRELYRMAVVKFLGNSLISRLERIDTSSAEAVLREVPTTKTVGQGDWLDICGLIAPKVQVMALMDDVQDGKITTMEQFDARLHELHNNYYRMEWVWAWNVMQQFFGIDELTIDKLIEIITAWRDAVVGIDKMLYNDARKEFSMSAQTGFGVDGHERTAQADFEQVRGTFDTNPFVTATLEHIKTKSALADKWLERLKSLA